MKNYIIGFILMIVVQVTGQIRPPGMSDMTFINNAGDFLEHAVPQLQDRNALLSSKQSIASQSESILKQLAWINTGGYLIQVRVYESPLTRAAVSMNSEFLGVGNDPADIIAASRLKPVITESVPGNLILSERSFYLWVSRQNKFLSGKQKLVYGKIDGHLADNVNLAALNKIATTDLINNFLEERKSYFLNGIIEGLREEVKNKTVALRTIQRIEQYREHTERLKNLDLKLQNDLKKIEQANQVLNTLKSFQGILSLASMTLQVNAALEDIPKEKINSAQSPTDLIRITEEYRETKNGQVSTYRSEITVEGENLQDLKGTIIQDLKDVDVPTEVIVPGLH